MKYTISFEENKVAQVVIVEASTDEAAMSYFKSRKPDANIYGVRDTQPYDMKPGIPVLVAPDDGEAPLKAFLFKKTLKARRDINKYGERSCLGSHAVQVWRQMESLLNEAGLWDEYEAWETAQGGHGG